MANMWARSPAGQWHHMPRIVPLSTGGEARALWEWQSTTLQPSGEWVRLIVLWAPSAATTTVEVSQDALSGGPVTVTAFPPVAYPEYPRYFRIYRNGALWETATTQAGINSIDVSGGLFSNGDAITADVRFLADGGRLGDSSPVSPPHYYRG